MSFPSRPRHNCRAIGGGGKPPGWSDGWWNCEPSDLLSLRLAGLWSCTWRSLATEHAESITWLLMGLLLSKGVYRHIQATKCDHRTCKSGQNQSFALACFCTVALHSELTIHSRNEGNDPQRQHKSPSGLWLVPYEQSPNVIDSKFFWTVLQTSWHLGQDPGFLLWICEIAETNIDEPVVKTCIWLQMVDLKYVFWKIFRFNSSILPHGHLDPFSHSSSYYIFLKISWTRSFVRIWCRSNMAILMGSLWWNTPL